MALEVHERVRSHEYDLDIVLLLQDTGRVDAVANFAQPPVADDYLRIRGLGFGNGFVHCGRERNGMTAVLEILTDCESGRIVIVQHEDAQREIGSVID